MGPSDRYHPHCRMSFLPSLDTSFSGVWGVEIMASPFPVTICQVSHIDKFERGQHPLLIKIILCLRSILTKNPHNPIVHSQVQLYLPERGLSYSSLQITYPTMVIVQIRLPFSLLQPSHPYLISNHGQVSIHHLRSRWSRIMYRIP